MKCCPRGFKYGCVPVQLIQEAVSFDNDIRRLFFFFFIVVGAGILYLMYSLVNIAETKHSFSPVYLTGFGLLWFCFLFHN